MKRILLVILLGAFSFVGFTQTDTLQAELYSEIQQYTSLIESNYSAISQSTSQEEIAERAEEIRLKTKELQGKVGDYFVCSGDEALSIMYSGLAASYASTCPSLSGAYYGLSAGYSEDCPAELGSIKSWLEQIRHWAWRLKLTENSAKIEKFNDKILKASLMPPVDI